MGEHVDIGTARLWVERRGSGPPLVWCHGGPGLWDYLAPLAELTDDVSTSYRYDQRACGRSTGDGPHTVASHVADLDVLRRHFGHEQWIVGGHSWGAMLALFYALAYPESTAGLIYVSGVGINPSWRADFTANRAARLRPELLAEIQRLRTRAAETGGLEDERAFCEVQWSCDFVDSERARGHARNMFVDGARVNNTVHAELWADVQRLATADELVQQVRQLEVPALLVHGAHDMRPHWPVEELSELLPNGEFVLLQNSAHFPWVEERELLGEVIREFVVKQS